MPRLPTGTVTFLFTDIEGSTTLIHHLGDRRYAEILAEHRQLLRTVVEARGGHVVDMQGDAFLVAFQGARDAAAAAVAAQRAVAARSWPEGTPVRVRMGLHTGEPVHTGSGYVGLGVHRAARICAAGWGGQILLSQTTCDLVENDLPEGASLRDLGEHRLKDLKRPEKIFQLLHPDLPADFPPLRALDAFPNNLPIQLTSFIGRERERTEIRRLLATTRLLTLTGAGGAGKTRLALQVAAELVEEFPDGSWLVECAPLTDPALVPHAVASALSLPELPGRDLLTGLLNYLRSKYLLLVLDNCEHLVEACARLADALLRACPRLRILTTSREPLGVAGERSWRIPSLSLPEPGPLPPLEGLAEFEAVRLFMERAAAAASIALTPRNAAAVVEVCHQLDGIPLAIELAAARTRVLSPEQIATRLRDRFRLLTGGSRTAIPRHRTLRAAMDWSYDLLEQHEQILFRRLAVFVDGFTLDAAEGVCAGDELEVDDVLDVLTRLVDKSLVLAEDIDGVRYRLLETVRQYARERLLEFEDEDAVRRAHRDWYLTFSEEAAQKLWGQEQPQWLARLEQEHGNVRTALEWSVARADLEAGLRLAVAVWPFWSRRGHLSEGREWLDLLLAGSDGVSKSLRARALNGAGVLAWYQGDNDRAATLCVESLVLFQELGEAWGLAWTRYNLGVVALRQGNYDRARSLLDESLAIFRREHEVGGIAYALDWLGLIALSQSDYTAATIFLQESLALFRELGDRAGSAYNLHKQGNVALVQGDYPRARILQEESLALFRELKEKVGMATALGSLGNVAWREGDYRTARAMLEEGLTRFRELGDKWGVAACQNVLGIVARVEGAYEEASARHEESLTIQGEVGDRAGIAASRSHLGRVAQSLHEHDRARRLFQESLATRRTLGDKRAVAETLEGLAGVALAQDEPGRAARLLGQAEALRESVGAPLPPPDHADHQHRIAATRAGLGDEGFAAAWAEGRAMTLGQAFAYALGEAQNT